MSVGALFSSPALGSVAENIVALLIYCSDRTELVDVDSIKIDKICIESLSKSGAGVIRSDQTKKRLIGRLRHTRVEHVMNDLQRHGVPIADNYFSKNFAQIISTKNAAKIGPSFVKHFCKKLNASKKLSQNILLNFVDVLEQGYWQLQGEAWDELNDIIDTLQTIRKQTDVVVPQIVEAELDSPAIADSEPQSGEIGEVADSLNFADLNIEFDEAEEESMMKAANVILGNTPEDDGEVTAETDNASGNGTPHENNNTESLETALEDALDLHPEDIVTPDIYPSSNGQNFKDNLHDLTFAELESAEEELYPSAPLEAAAQEDSSTDSGDTGGDKVSDSVDDSSPGEELLSDLDNLDFEDSAEWDVAEDFQGDEISDQQVEDEIVAGLRKLVSDEGEEEEFDDQLLADDDELLFEDLDEALLDDDDVPDGDEKEVTKKKKSESEIDLDPEELLELEFDSLENRDEAGSDSDNLDLGDPEDASENKTEPVVDSANIEEIVEYTAEEAVDSDISEPMEIDDVIDVSWDNSEPVDTFLDLAADLEEQVAASEDVETVDPDLEANPGIGDEDPIHLAAELDEQVAASEDVETVNSDLEANPGINDEDPIDLAADVEEPLDRDIDDEDPIDIGAHVAESVNLDLEGDAIGEDVESLMADLDDDLDDNEIVTEPLNANDESSELIDDDVDPGNSEPLESEEADHEFLSITKAASDDDHESEAFSEQELLRPDFWREKNLIMPVRGLRNLELGLQDKPILFLAGPAGCGKSTFVSGYLAGLTESGQLDNSRIFNYRFPQGETDAEAFLSALNTFFQKHNIEFSGPDTTERWANLLLHSNGYFIGSGKLG